MPWPVYSERFILAGNAVNTWVYTVPAGRRVIVKSITVVNYNSLAGIVQVNVGGWAAYRRSFPASEASVYFEVMAVAYAGETVMMSMSALGYVVGVHGWLLDSTAAVQDEPPPLELLGAPVPLPAAA